MSQTLKIANFNNNNIVARTVVTSDLAAGVNSIPVENSNDFVAGPILFGAPGSTNPEILTITAPASAQLLPTSSVTKLPHNNFDPIIQLFGSQINVYSANDIYGNGTQPPDTNFTKLSGSPYNIDANQVFTTVVDSAGVAGMWYKFTYWNPTTSQETALVDSNAVQVGQTHYVSLDQIRRAAGFTNSPNVTDDIVAEFRDAAEREINGALLPVYQFPLPQPANPLIVQIAKNIAAGELRYEMFQNSAPQIAADAMGKADAARHGGGSHTSLDELVTRDVVLEDANFTELTIEEGHGFGGWPDATTQFVSQNQEDSNGNLIDLGGDDGHQFQITQDY